MPRPTAPEGMKRLLVSDKFFDKIEKELAALGPAAKEEKKAYQEGREPTLLVEDVRKRIVKALQAEWPVIKEASGIKPAPEPKAPAKAPAKSKAEKTTEALIGKLPEEKPSRRPALIKKPKTNPAEV